MSNKVWKHVLITGAAGGIGAEICQQLLTSSEKMTLVGRSEPALLQLKQRLLQQKPQQTIDIITCDLVNAQQRSELASQVTNVDLLINNAGTLALDFLSEQTSQQIQQQIELNLLAPIDLTRLLLNQLEQQPSASIVNIGSALGFIGMPAHSVYCASKAGLQSFSESLRRELSDSNISVLHIAPRATDTQLNDQRMRHLNQQTGSKTDSARWVAEQVVAAINKQTAETVLGWPEKLFARINKIAPSVVDNALAKKLPTVRQCLNPSTQSPV